MLIKAMWVLFAIFLSRPVIHAISKQTASTILASWIRDPSFTRHHHPMHNEVSRSAWRVTQDMTNTTGFVALMNANSRPCAIVAFENDDDFTVHVRDIACMDYESGSTLMRAIVKTPGTRCAEGLPYRWKIAHAYHSSSRSGK